MARGLEGVLETHEEGARGSRDVITWCDHNMIPLEGDVPPGIAARCRRTGMQAHVCTRCGIIGVGVIRTIPQGATDSRAEPPPRREPEAPGRIEIRECCRDRSNLQLDRVVSKPGCKHKLPTTIWRCNVCGTEMTTQDINGITDLRL